MSDKTVYILEYLNIMDTDYVFAGVYSSEEKAEKEASKLRRMMHIDHVSINETLLDEEFKLDEF